MAKAFKSIEELISLMEARGIKTDDDAKLALARESYYAIANGYKRPFLDTDAMTRSNDDVYKPGVEFRWMYDLFLFDRDLRFATFQYLTRAEAIVRTAVVHVFCRNHREESSYLDVSNFCASSEMLTPRAFKGSVKSLHQRNISKLMATLNEKLVIKSKTRPFIKHYLAKHGHVPLWVLANDLTFGNMVHFYQLMRRNEQNEVCSMIAKTKGRRSKQEGTLSPRDLLRAANVLVDFRNICAHDERLYCAKSGNDDFYVMTSMLLKILPHVEVEEFVDDIFRLFDKYDGRLHHVTPISLLSDMGFRVSGERGRLHS